MLPSLNVLNRTTEEQRWERCTLVFDGQRQASQPLALELQEIAITTNYCYCFFITVTLTLILLPLLFVMLL